MATGKILLAEILEHEEVPLVVLYDTSQDDDININAACMKALQDRSLESPLKVTKNRSVILQSMKPSYPKYTVLACTKSLQYLYYYSTYTNYISTFGKTFGQSNLRTGSAV